MKTIGQFLGEHARSVCCVAPTSTVREALELMAKENIGAVLVQNGPVLVGIFSERDYARKVVLHGKTSGEALVQEIMTAKVITVTPEQHIDACMQIMTEHHIRHLPIMGANQVLGLISIGDVVREMMAQQKLIIDQLHSYISG
ncbi:MAG: CBS domain-containing protein [Betaproteobacteria bacterium]